MPQSHWPFISDLYSKLSSSRQNATGNIHSLYYTILSAYTIHTKNLGEIILGCPAPLKEPMSVILKNADFIVLFFCSEFKIYVNRYLGSKGIYIALISSTTRAIILSRRFSPLIKIGRRGDEVRGPGVDGQEFLQHAEFVETGER